MWTWWWWLFLLLRAQAHEGYLGVHGGVTDASGPFTKKEAGASAGARAGVLVYERMGLGVYTQLYYSNEPLTKIAMVPMLAELTYYTARSPFEPSSLFVSALFGTTHLITKTAGLSTTENATTFGATAGYSVLLAERYSVGPEVHYFFVFGDENFSFWSVVFSVKYLF